MTEKTYKILSFETGDMMNGKNYGYANNLLEARIKACAVANKNPLCMIGIYPMEKNAYPEFVTYFREKDHIGHDLTSKEKRSLNKTWGLYFKEAYYLKQRMPNRMYRTCRISPNTGKRLSEWISGYD